MNEPVEKKTSLDDYLDNVDYVKINNYVPSEFALNFMNFIKLVNGSEGESNKTPPIHLMMLDKLTEKNKYVVNLCYRGSGKTTVFAEYLPLYLACFRKLPNLGTIDGAIYVSDSMENGVKSLRNNIEHRYNNSEFLQKYLPFGQQKFTDSAITFTNADGKTFGLKMFGATTGIRGTKINGKRPVLAILDDLMSDEAARSPTILKSIKDTIYKGIMPALDPTKGRVIFNGTPFNSQDVMVEAVESGAWNVNVYPVCEKFPCDPKEFHGAWEDRFPYEVVKEKYDLAIGTGHPDAFYQELMLRISSADERLIQESEIRWYSRMSLLNKKANFNFYITTDFATSAKQTADWSVISVWAYNSNGDWFWVDGVCEQQTMNDNIDCLFRLCQQYRPISVGIEVTGQQGAFIQWLQKEMMERNIWFNFASNKGNTPGIRPETDKLTRFNMVVPWFKMGKMYFPEELKTSKIMGEFMKEINLCTKAGIKGHDDCIDTISMLAYINPWKPSFESEIEIQDNTKRSKYWIQADILPTESSEMDSYIV